MQYAQKLQDYPQIAKGMKNLGIKQLTDFQNQFLDFNKQGNMILIAPEDSGKILAISINTIKMLYNEQNGYVLFLAHSKQLSQKCFHILTTISNIPTINLFMQKIPSLIPSKAIFIGSPLHALQIDTKTIQLEKVVIPEAQLLINYGYKTSLYQLASNLPKNTYYQLVFTKIQPDIQEFKEKFMEKTFRIEFNPTQPQMQQQGQKIQSLLNHFYSVGDALTVPISVYVTLKLSLVNPKILILCEDIKQVYRYYLFLERSNITGIGLYNHLNPVNLKLYTLSLWNSGNVNILLATNDIIHDLHNFASNKKFYRVSLPLTNLSTIIQLNIININQQLERMLALFNSKVMIMTFIQNQKQNQFNEFIEQVNKLYETVKSNALPLTKDEIDRFRYRINDLYSSIGHKRVLSFMELDLKKKVLRSPDLKEYFQNNQNQRELLVKSIQQLANKVQHNKVTLSEHLPPYLIPETFKHLYETQHKQQSTAQLPTYHRTAASIIKKVNMQEQNPQITQVGQLKIISARKRWKLQHGFKLHKRNLRNEKKGIFQKP